MLPGGHSRQLSECRIRQLPQSAPSDVAKGPFPATRRAQHPSVASKRPSDVARAPIPATQRASHPSVASKRPLGCRQGAILRNSASIASVSYLKAPFGCSGCPGAPGCCAGRDATWRPLTLTQAAATGNSSTHPPPTCQLRPLPGHPRGTKWQLSERRARQVPQSTPPDDARRRFAATRRQSHPSGAAKRPFRCAEAGLCGNSAHTERTEHTAHTERAARRPTVTAAPAGTRARPPSPAR